MPRALSWSIPLIFPEASVHNTYGQTIAVDADGNAYVAGYTNDPKFPISAGAFQTICGDTQSMGFAVPTARAGP